LNALIEIAANAAKGLIKSYQRPPESFG